MRRNQSKKVVDDDNSDQDDDIHAVAHKDLKKSLLKKSPRSES